MPQPLSGLKHDPKKITFGNGASLRPTLAQQGMEVISRWSLVDANMHGVFVKMLGANPAPAAAMFKALVGAAAQREALLALAKLSLTTEQNEAFVAIVRVHKSLQSQRNKVAHWIWGATVDLPDQVLLIHPAAALSAEVRVATQFQGAHWSIVFVERTAWPADDIMVYSSRDFAELTDRIRRLRRWLETLRAVLDTASPLPGREAAARFHQLCNEPEIRAGIDHQRRHPKTPPSVPPPPPQTPPTPTE